MEDKYRFMKKEETHSISVCKYIYHNGTIMFQGNEACLSSVQANFSSLKALAERLDSHVGTKSAGWSQKRGAYPGLWHTAGAVGYSDTKQSVPTRGGTGVTQRTGALTYNIQRVYTAPGKQSY